MKKLLVLMAVLAISANFAMAHIVAGTAPVSHTVDITVTIPPRVGIDITDHAPLLDLTADLTYPPAGPTDYPFLATHQISVLSLITYDFSYTCTFTGPALSTLVMGDLSYQANGWAGPVWTGFAPGPVDLETAHARTVGWSARNLDYQVNLDGSETDGNHVWTVIYTMDAP